MPIKLMNAFKGDLKRTFDTRGFVDGEDEDIQHLKYCILQSARLAFHFSFESFVMGEFDLPDPTSFIVSNFSFIIIKLISNLNIE